MEKLLLKEKFADLVLKVLHYEESAVRNMMVIYEANSLSVSLLNYFTQKEMTAHTTEPDTVFRADSACTKLFRKYAMIVGLPYLWKTLGKVLHEVMEESEKGRESGGEDFEVDPNRVSTEDVDEGIRKFNLLLLCQKIFVAIKKSVVDVPPEIREFFKNMKDDLKEAIPSAEPTQVIGSFFFLRLICPALIQPQKYGLLPDPVEGQWGPKTARVLILVGKVLQSLSNKADFGNKEDFMSKLNEFVATNKTAMVQFVDELVNCDIINVQPLEDTIPKPIHNQAMKMLHRAVAKNEEAICEEINKQYDDENAKKLKDRIVLLT